MKREQLEAFNDAVVAIIVTLMVLEIKLPEFESGEYLPLARHIAIYALSFLVVAITWLNNHTTMAHLERVGIRIIWLNMLLLFCMSLIPLPTAALGEQFHLRDAHIFYAIVVGACSAAFTLLHREMFKELHHIPAEVRASTTRMHWITVSCYACAVLLAYVSVYLSLLVFIAMPSLYFIPSRRLFVATE